MRNPNSSDTMAEDLMRVITQLVCAEGHLKTLLEKSNAELENGLIDVEDEKVLENQLGKIEIIKGELIDTAQLRRKSMKKLFDMYEGDPTWWCMVKHLASASYTAFEVWQASSDDPELLAIAIETNKRFVTALTVFLGTEVTECAACFGDILKAKENEA